MRELSLPAAPLLRRTPEESEASGALGYSRYFGLSVVAYLERDLSGASFVERSESVMVPSDLLPICSPRRKRVR